MGSPSNLFSVALYCFVFTVVHIHGDLFQLIHMHSIDTHSRSYTCISEDDGSALAWIYFEAPIRKENFEPKRLATGNVRDCGIRGESTCLAKWDKTNHWRVVNSAAKPTGPVFDQRWEDFRQFRIVSALYHWQFSTMGVVNKSSSTVWFSGTNLGRGRFGVLLCEREEPHLGRCVWIQSSGHIIEVRSCARGAASQFRRINESRCTVESRIDEPTFSDLRHDEWHTLRLEWNTKQKTIKMFLGNNSEPLVEGPMPPWDKVSAVGATSMGYLGGSLLRFHFFDYYFTDTKNAVISTKGIEHSGKMFCVELLLALCPRCKLNVTLADEYGSGIETWPFSGDEQDPYNGLLAWRLVKLTTRFDSDIRRRLTLKIETILDGDKGAGEWAIDKFRICQTGKLRQSKITMTSSPNAQCQKMSYAGSSVARIRQLGANETQALSELQDFLRYRNMTLGGKGESICSPSGCMCDRGFTGPDSPAWNTCMDVCYDGFYGYSCTKTCGSCRYSEPCVKSTGFCRRGCHRDNMIKPLCKTAIVAPTVENVGSTTATLIQNVEFADKDEVLNRIEFQIREAGGESWMNFTANWKDSRVSSGYGAYIRDLKPSTAYVVRAAAFVETELGPTVTFGVEYNLKTTCSERSGLMVIPGRRSLTIELDEEGQTHNNLGHPFSVLVTNALTDHVAFSVCGTSLAFNVTGLTPSTEYDVKIVDTITRCTLLDMRLRTFGPAPLEIWNLGVQSISDTEVTLQWDPSAQENGVVMRSYGVSLKLTELKGCTDLNKLTPPEEEIVRIVNETTVLFDGLHPYAKYVVSVAAQTPKPGPPVSLFFETGFAVIPTSMVSNLRVTEDKSCVLWDKPADCTTITGPTVVTRLFFTRVSDSALIKQVQTRHSYFNLSELHLEPLTWHKMYVHCVRGYDELENPDVYQELTWRTNFDAPTVVDVTDSTARIIQNVASPKTDGKIFVTFILREVTSNESFGLFPTHTTADDHVLYARNLKPKTLYKVHTLVTILEPDRTATLDGSPILFKTKCLDEPYFEVSPGEHGLTIRVSSPPEGCKHSANKVYSMNVYDTAKGSLVSSVSFASSPVLIPELSPDTEYKVKIWMRRQKMPHLVFTTNVRTSALKEAVLQAS